MLLKRLGVGVLSFQLIFGLPWTAHVVPRAEAQEWTSYAPAPEWQGAEHPDSAILDPVLQRFERGELTDREKDPFHLRNQRVELPDGRGGVRTYDLSDPNTMIPRVAFDSFETRFDRDKRELIIEAFAAGRLVGRHVLGNIDVVAQVRYGKLLNFIDSNGRVYGADYGLWFRYGLQQALPLVDLVGHTDISSRAVSLAYWTPGMLAPLAEGARLPVGLDGKPFLEAGDLAVLVDGKIDGIYARKTMFKSMERATEMYAMQVVVAAPEEVSAKVARELFDVEYEALRPAYRDAVRAGSLGINEETEQVLRRTDQDLVELLVKRLSALRRQADRPRDGSTLDTWAEDKLSLTARAKQILESNKLPPEAHQALAAALKGGDLGEHWRDLHEPNDPEAKLKLLSERLTSRGMRIVAAIAAGSGASVAYAQGLDGKGPEFFVNASNFIYTNLVPDVLKVAEYQFPLWASMTTATVVLPSMFWLSSVALLPALQFIGSSLRYVGGLERRVSDQILSRAFEFMGVNGESMIARSIQSLSRFPGLALETAGTLATRPGESLRAATGYLGIRRLLTIGIRVFAICNTAAFRVVATSLGQPAFIDAVRERRVPWEVILKDSPLGEQLGLEADMRLGMNFPAYGNRGQEVRAERMRALGALRGQDLSRRSQARVLAALVISSETGTEAAELLAAGSIDGGLRRLAEVGETPEGEKLLEDVTNEYMRELNRAKMDLLDGKLGEVPETEMRDALEEIARIADELRSDPRARRYAQIRSKFRSLRIEAWRGFWGWGEVQTQFMLRSLPNKGVVDTVMREGVTDIVVTGPGMGLIGDRARVSDPGALTFRIDGTGGYRNGYLTQAHAVDMVENVLAHLMTSAGTTMLQRQGDPVIEEPNFRPREDITQRSRDRSPSYLRSVIKYALDLRPTVSDLGGDYWTTFINRFATIQALVIVSVSMRMLIGGQTFENAAAAYGFIWLARMMYACVWNPTQLGNIAHERWINDGLQRFRGSKTRLSQALRNTTDPTEPAREMQELYERDWRETAARLRYSIRLAETLLSGSEADVREAQATASPSLIARLFGGARTPELEVLRRIRNSDNFLVRFGTLKNDHPLVRYQDALARLGVASHYGRRQEAQTIAKELVELYNGRGLDAAVLGKMSPETLRDFAIINPPVYTRPLQALMFGSTLLVGGVVSTYLWSRISVLSFKPEELTGDLYMEAAKFTAIFHASTLLILGKKVWDRVLYQMNPDGRPKQEIVEGEARPVRTLAGRVLLKPWDICERALTRFDSRGRFPRAR